MIVIKFKDLENKILSYRSRATTQDNEEILQYMMAGTGPYKICRLCGIDTYQAENKIKKELSSDFSKEELEDLFECYFRLLYFPLLRFKKGLLISDFIDTCEIFLKRQTYQDFLNFMPNPATIFSSLLDDTESLKRVYNINLNEFSILEIENSVKIQFEIRHKISHLLRAANVAYVKGEYIDYRTKETLNFEYN